MRRDLKQYITGQFGTHFGSKAIGKIRLFGVAAQIVEGHHSNACRSNRFASDQPRKPGRAAYSGKARDTATNHHLPAINAAKPGRRGHRPLTGPVMQSCLRAKQILHFRGVRPYLGRSCIVYLKLPETKWRFAAINRQRNKAFAIAATRCLVLNPV